VLQGPAPLHISSLLTPASLPFLYHGLATTLSSSLYNSSSQHLLCVYLVLSPSPPPPRYPAETISSLSLILLKREYKQ
jgi:hypothetical protein